MNKIKVIGATILGFLALIVAFFYQRSKAKSNEALVENIKTKEKLQELNKEKLENDASLKLEEDKRKELSEELKKEQNEKVSDNDLTDFFNKR